MRLKLSLRSAREGRRLESGQAIIIVAASFIGMAAFIGLAIDLGILIVSQAHLQRAVDSAAIAAATQIREAQPLSNIGPFADEFIRFNNVDVGSVVVQQCRRSGSTTTVDEYSHPSGVITGTITNYLLTDPALNPTAVQMCSGEPRKQIRVQATMNVQFTFLMLLGFSNIDIDVDAVSEAASLDVVVVLSTSETMGQNTHPLGTCYGRLVNTDVCTNSFDPRDPALVPGASPGCNANAGPEAVKQPEQDPLYNNDFSIPVKCRPLWDAKQAAKKLVDTLYAGFDRVAVVGYDSAARIYPNPIDSRALSLNLGQRATATTPSTGTFAALDSMELRNTELPTGLDYGMFSPVNSDCISGPGAMAGAECQTPDPDKSVAANCAGCGIRVATNILKQTGRPESLWVIVFLSDGYTNMTDLPDVYVPGQSSTSLTQSGLNQTTFRYGYCPGSVSETPFSYGTRIWTSPICLQGNFDLNGNGSVDSPFEPLTINPLVRFCGPYHLGGAATCPPGSIYVGTVGFTSTAVVSMPTVITYTGVTAPYYYNAYDYARDEVDFAALTTRCGPSAGDCGGSALQTSIPAGTLADRYNSNEQGTRLAGANIVIYSIGLGPEVIASSRQGETLLRYMAAVGDDGDRVTDSCATTPSGSNCGNYYFAPDPSALGPVFEDIARRIFTRITR